MSFWFPFNINQHKQGHPQKIHIYIYMYTHISIYIHTQLQLQTLKDKGTLFEVDKGDYSTSSTVVGPEVAHFCWDTQETK